MAAESEDIVEIETHNHIPDTKLSDEQKRNFIKDLKEHPSLWSTNSAEYKNKNIKLKSSEELSKKYDIDVAGVKSLIHSFRGSLTREMKKGNEGSKWKFYQALGFMKEDIERSAKAREMQEWSAEEIEKLIDFYRENEQLWNHRLQTYRDRNLKEVNLRALSATLTNRTVPDIKKQWESLKTIFYREIKREEGSKVSGTGTDEVYTSGWKHLKPLMFLKGHNEMDQQLSTLECDTIPDEKPAKRPRSGSKKQETPSKEFEATKIELYKEAIKCLKFPTEQPQPSQHNQDDITMFLKNIEATLRTFPPQYLALAKRKLFEVVSDLEIGLYNNPQPASKQAPPRAPLRSLNIDEVDQNWPYSSCSFTQF